MFPKDGLLRLKVEVENAGMRLDVFAARAMPDLSRHAVKRLIAEGSILLNGKKAKPSKTVLAGATVAISEEAVQKLAKPLSLLSDSSIPLSILYEDNDLLVIEKPAGISVHPSPKEQSGTLANALVAYLPRLRRVGENPIRPGIVHRLDKDTSGLLVIAKNQKTFLWLKEQFSKRLVEKHYLALVEGIIKERSGSIALPLTKRGLQHVSARAAKTTHEQQTLFSPAATQPHEATGKSARDAVTEFKILRRFKDATFVAVHPKTGRMHQIRSHFKAIGYPIAGDTLYGKKKRPEGLSRHFLHAWRLEFGMSDARRMSFESELPPDLAEYLSKLREPSRIDNETEVRYD